MISRSKLYLRSSPSVPRNPRRHLHFTAACLSRLLSSLTIYMSTDFGWHLAHAKPRFHDKRNVMEHRKNAWLHDALLTKRVIYGTFCIPFRRHRS